MIMTTTAVAPIYESENIGVREIRGRDGRVKFWLYRPYDAKHSPIYDTPDQDQALQIARSVDAHGGDFSAAKKDKFAIPLKLEAQPQTVDHLRCSALQDNFAKALAVCARAATTKATLPVLQNLLLASDAGRLKLTATNLELTISTWIGAKIDGEGTLTLPARMLAEWAKTMPSERVDMDVNPRTSTMTLSCARFKANVKGITADEYPTLPRRGRYLGSADPDVLKQALSQTVFSAAKDESRPVLSGLEVEIDSHCISFNSADGFRMSLRTFSPLKTDLEKGERWHAIVPARALAEVERLIGDQEDPVQIAEDEGSHHVFFALANTEVVTTVIDGNYPPFRNLIADTHNTAITLNLSEFKNAITAVNVFAREAMSRTLIKIRPDAASDGRGLVSVFAESAESGNLLGEVDAEIEGEALELVLNSKYLDEVLDVLDGPQVRFEFVSASSPVCVRTPAIPEFVHVIMPMSLEK
jgi:DNA polymerase-3 subunit beta